MRADNPDRPDLFDTATLAARRDRAERLGFDGGADFLHREVAAALQARLAEVARSFGKIAVIGSGGGCHAAVLRQLYPEAAIRQLELSPRRAARAGAEHAARPDPLALEEGAHDLVVSALELHWANDPVGQLVQMRRALQPDGLLIAALFGGQTLAELRACLAEAETATTGGLSPRVAPMAEIRDLGALLQRAGLAMPVADCERFGTTYASPLALMHDLRAMGETNIVSARRRVFLRRDTLGQAMARYTDAFPAPEGRIRATFEVIFLTGWAPAEGQPQPLRPGSATARLADALGAEEKPAGDRASPGRPRRS